MQELFATIAKLKDTDANILILGENGTGKDLIARALYHHSPRCNRFYQYRSWEYPGTII